MKISYAIPVCNEWIELEYLLNYLLKHKREQDEIVVQCDEGNTTPSVYQVLEEHKEKIQIIEFPLNGDFSSFKNNLKDNCTGDYIFQIDADEYPEEYLMSTIEWIIKENPKTDIFWVPRINIVKGLTQEHINKWGWNICPKGRVNFPDYQCRILKNVKRIKWKNKVHEILTGHKTESHLPSNDEFCIHHLKDIERQEKQNDYYATL
jgi:glycosyltransferase involved in cell wall biosynthesis|tara:strand:- start:9373 stop:9990 length:618 start_codon:yes stop_codon:yes gene_type:complete